MTSRWSVQTTDQLDRDYRKLDRAVQRRVMAYLEEVETLDDPRQGGKALTANHAGASPAPVSGPAHPPAPPHNASTR